MSSKAPTGSGSRYAGSYLAARRPAVIAGLSLLCLVVVPSEATAADRHGDDISGDVIMMAGALPDSELDTYRGGFEVGGFMVSFGAQVRTLFEGKEMVSLLNFGERVGNRVPGTITSTLTDIATKQTVTLSGADQNAKVVQAITGNASVTYDFRQGILTVLKNASNNTTVNSKVTLDVGIANYQGMVRSAQVNSALAAAATSIRNASLRR